MTSLSGPLAGLSSKALVALVALGAVQLTLQIVALFDLARRAAVTGGRKWVWVVVIVLGGVLGASAYLAFGRAALQLPEGADASPAGTEGARRRALDTLYGPEKRS